MTADDSRRETETLIEAIWGVTAPDAPRPPLDPAVRAQQNQALAVALRAYLQQYLAEV